MKRLLGTATVAGVALAATLAAGSAHADPAPVLAQDRDNGTCVWVDQQQGHCLDVAGIQKLLDDLLKGQQSLVRGLTL